MKTKFYILIFLLAAASAHAQTSNLTSLLQQGLLEEQANGNLNAAIANYRSVADAFDKDRQLAATAVFRLGECFRMQGKTNEAAAQYQRVLRDFSDQTTLATLSRQNLTGLGVSVATTSGAPMLSDAARQEQKNLLDQEIKLFEQQLESQRQKVENGYLNSDNLTPTQEKLLELKRQLAAFDAGQPASIQGAGPSGKNTFVGVQEDQEIQRIQQMIQNSPDLINNGQLGKAAGSGQLRVATFLLDHGADVNGKSDGNPPITMAAMNAQKAMVELLLSRGADIEARDSSGATALFRATEGGYLAVVEVLLAHNPDVNARNSTANGENTPLHMAALRGYANLIKVLLAAGANPNLEDSVGRAPLSYAAEHGHLEVVKMLLAAKADPNGGTMDAPLFSAIEKSDATCAQVLLEAGANPHASGKINFNVNVDNTMHRGDSVPVTPLFYAIATGQLPMMRLLLKFKADPNDSQTENRSLLFPVLRDTNILETLLDAGAKVETAERVQPYGQWHEWTLLDAAANQNYASAVRVLLKHGANPNARDDAGETALHWAAMRVADGNVFKPLLDYNANPNVRDNSGRTPMDILKEYSHSAVPQNRNLAGTMIGWLREHGALDNLPNWDRIQIIPASTHDAETVFQKGTNDWNRFTLLDAILQYFRAGAKAIPFPDLTHVVIVRPNHDSTNLARIAFNLLNATNGIDCSKDMPLEFGDMVEIPQCDHPLGAAPWWLSQNQVSAMINHLHGTAQLVVRDQKVELPLDPGYTSTIGGVLHQTAAQQIILASSDLSRVKVTRHDPKTGKSTNWILDCSNPQLPPDLWLRDGDFIEVPEKP